MQFLNRRSFLGMFGAAVGGLAWWREKTSNERGDYSLSDVIGWAPGCITVNGKTIRLTIGLQEMLQHAAAMASEDRWLGGEHVIVAMRLREQGYVYEDSSHVDTILAREGKTRSDLMSSRIPSNATHVCRPHSGDVVTIDSVSMTISRVSGRQAECLWFDQESHLHKRELSIEEWNWTWLGPMDVGGHRFVATSRA